ncbi:MAG: LysE family translocator [Reyranellaceae bacterium]
MDYLLPLAGFALAHLLACASPGPSFVYVTHVAASRSRGAGVLVSLAMAVGALTWAAGALFGLQALLAQVAWLELALRLAGAAYLVWLGVTLLRSKAAPTAETVPQASTDNDRGTALGLFGRALVLQMSNPKVMVFFGSIFVALLPAAAPQWVFLVALAIVFVDEFLWYALLSLLFSTRRARDAFGRWRVWIDRATGGFLTVLGIRLALDR